jgi:integrase
MIGRMAKSFSKRDSRYWYGKIFQQTQGNGQVDANWSMRLAIGGKRRQLSLDSGNKQIAAERAAAIYAAAKDSGWDAALTAYASRRKPTPPPPASATVGAVIRVIEERGTHLRTSTKLRIYSALRVISASAAGIEEYNTRATNAAKSARRDRIDKIDLATVTPDLVRRWQRDFIAGADDDLHLACKKRSSDGTIAAFSRAWTAALAPHYGDAALTMPSNPAKSVRLFRLKTPRYRSDVDVAALVRDAKDQLSGDGYRTLVLALQFGLRRAEVDRIQWQHVDLVTGQLSVEGTEAGATKTGASARVLDISPGMVAVLAEWKEEAIGDYVVAPLAALRPKRWSSYRADAAFEEVLRWLRGRGWDSAQPLHQLRKEFGSAVSMNFGVFEASEALGHSDVRVTAALYVAAKRAIHLDLPE